MNNDLSRYTVLVVDDAADSLSLISDVLDQHGVSTLVALDGKQALSIASNLRPDLILLDAIMPNMDGFETCSQLKLLPGLAAVPVMFMTGLSDTDSIVKGLSVGGVDYLTKPVNPQELVARMKVHLNNAATTENAYHVMDSLGHTAIMVDEHAQVLWASPDARAVLALIKWSANNEEISYWLGQNPEPNSRKTLVLEGDEFAEIRVIEKRSEKQFSLRIVINSPTMGATTLQKMLMITQRESQVLFWLANGKSNKEIAEILGMGVRTVNKHLEQMFPKLGVENRTAAAGTAIRILY